jgi:hypothetical protein
VKITTTTNAEVARMFDGLEETPCRVCGGPCVIPGDVMGIVVVNGTAEPVAACPECAQYLLRAIRGMGDGG